MQGGASVGWVGVSDPKQDSGVQEEEEEEDRERREEEGARGGFAQVMKRRTPRKTRSRA